MIIDVPALTNGRMFTRMFPDLKIANELDGVVTIYTKCSDGLEFVTHFDKDWWDSPYKKEVEK